MVFDLNLILFDALENENATLRHQLQSQSQNVQSQEHNRNIIDSLRSDNEMLNQALNQLTQESEEVKKREAEAAEEVTKSLNIVWEMNINYFPSIS